MIERFFSALTTQQLRRAADRSVPALHTRIYAYLDEHNRHPRPFVWTKTADEILASVARFCVPYFKFGTLEQAPCLDRASSLRSLWRLPRHARGAASP